MRDLKKEQFTEDRIVWILREAETTMIEDAARQHRVLEQSVYRQK
jgi:hypothetical protein